MGKKQLPDLDGIMDWMDARGIGSGPIQDVRSLAGGTQNIVLRLTRGSADFILRRPALHPRPEASKVLGREARLLTALRDTAVPCPRVIAAETDIGVLGYAFYMMEPVNGFNPALGLPQHHAGSAAIRHAMGLAIIDALLTLGKIDPVSRGLADFGKPEGFLDRQVTRWRAQFESYRDVAGWPGSTPLEGIEDVGQWLENHRPTAFTPGLMHGDYHAANLMFDHDGPGVAAILDWEMATIGDPLIDLGWLLATWPDGEGKGGAVLIEPWQGFPSVAEIIARYAAGTTRDLSALNWYRAFAAFKLAVVLEGTHARARAGKVGMDVGDQFHANARAAIDRASRAIFGRA